MAGSTTIADMKRKYDHAELIRKALETICVIGPADIALPEHLFGDNGQLLELPEGWWGLGVVKKDGYEFGTETDSSDVEGHGYNDSLRTDIIKIARSISVTALEKFKKQFIELTEGVNLSNVKQAANGEINYKTPSIVKMGEYRMILLARDGRPEEEWIWAKVYPKVQLTEFPADAWGNDALETPLKFKILTDTKVGWTVDTFIGGTGAKKHGKLLDFGQATGTSTPGSGS